MRVSKSSSAYEYNIIRKSNIVNNMGIMYMKENNNIYGFVHNGKIYLNPELMNSNAAVHEYTHLWDAYTQKTNPELWNKGLEIFQKYDNIPVPIAVLPERAVIIFNNLSNRYIYSGKAYFIDHMVNNHAELDADEFQNFQDDLNSFEKVYLDPKNSSIIFEKDKNNKKYSIVLKQDFQGNLLFYKSYHYGSKTKNRFVEIDLEALREKISVEVGNSSINHPDEPGLGRLLSALTDINNLLPKFDSVNKVKQSMKLSDGTTYGFVHNGKIYLNPELMNSNAAVHEYTHLWDAYTQKTNPELWNKGLEIFKETKYWNEVIFDPNYQDIKDDKNLVLSEIHSRICGEIAEQVLNRIAELDGEQSHSANGDSHVVKENGNFLSRVRQVSYSSLGQESYPFINKNYNKDSILSSKESGCNVAPGFFIL